MPTVPVKFFFGAAGFLGLGAPIGRYVYARTTVPDVRMVYPLEGEFPRYRDANLFRFGYGDSGAGTTSAELLAGIEVTPAQLLDNNSPVGTLINGTISYPEGGIWEGLTHARVVDRVDGNGGSSGSGFYPLGWSAEFNCIDGYVVVERDGHTYKFTGAAVGTSTAYVRAAITRVEFMVNGEIHNASLAVLPDSNGPDADQGVLFRLSQYGSNAVSINFSYTFQNGDSASNLRVRAFDEIGCSTTWKPIAMPPVADFTITGSENPIRVNGDKSFSPTGKIKLFYWEYANTNLANGVHTKGVEKNGKIETDIDTSAGFTELLGPQNKTIYLTIVDDSGLTTNNIGQSTRVLIPLPEYDGTGLTGTTWKTTVVTPPGYASLVHSQHGETFIATPDEQSGLPGVALSRTITNTGQSRALSFTKLSAKGTLYQNTSGVMFMLAANAFMFNEGYAANNWDVWRTLDCGETFTPMLIAVPFYQIDYPAAVPCQNIADGMQAIAAIKNGTRDIYVSFYNGASWETPKVAATLPEDAVKSFGFFQETPSGGSRFRIVSPSIDYCSDDYGDTWEPTP